MNGNRSGSTSFAGSAGTIGRALLVAAVLSVPAVAGAEAQGVRYFIAPGAHQLRWDDNLGLEDETVYGARIGIDFGRLVALQGYYMTKDAIPTRLSSLALVDNSGQALQDQTVDFRSFGGDVLFKLGWGRLVPYVKAGAGVVRFTPADGAEVEQIDVKLGGGLQYAFGDGIRAEVFAERSQFRLDRYALAPGGRASGNYPEDPEANDLRDNVRLGAAIGFALGGSGAARSDERWSFASIPVEPFAGRLEFDDDALGRQNVAGLRAGLDVGNYLGLRGSYWRGVNNDFDDTEPLKGYGAEAQFNLNAGLGPAPYLVVGAGRLEFKDEFRDANDNRPADQDFLVLGAGVGLRLTNNFRLNIAARDHIMSAMKAEDIARPDELTHNWMYTAGLTFNLGRGRSSVAPSPVPAPMREDEARSEREARAGQAGERRDVEVTERARGEQTRERTTETRAAAGAAREAGAATVERRDARGRVIETVVMPSERVVAIPVPERGEVYIRYGEGGRMTVTEAGQAAQTVVGSTELTDEQLDRIARAVSARLEDRMDDRMRRDTESLRDLIRAELQRMDTPVRVEVQAPPGAAAEPGAAPVVVESQRSGGAFSRVESPAFYAGLGLNSPAQFVIGSRVMTGRLSGASALAVVPEFALGFSGDGTSWMAVANLEREFSQRRIGNNFDFFPHLRLGLGFLSVPDVGSEAVLNFTWGISSQLGDGRMRWFVEHQGIDLFDRNRLNAGIRLMR